MSKNYNFFILMIIFSINGMFSLRASSAYCDSVKFFICLLADLGINTTLHEFGHAIAGKILYNSPIDVYLGKSYNEKLIDEKNGDKEPFFKFGPITIIGSDFASGYAKINSYDYCHGKGVINKIKRILLLLSGPIITFLYLNKRIKSQIKNDFIHFIYKLVIIDQILIGFTPFHPQVTDGNEIWKELGLNINEKIKWFLYLGTLILASKYTKWK